MRDKIEFWLLIALMIIAAILGAVFVLVLIVLTLPATLLAIIVSPFCRADHKETGKNERKEKNERPTNSRADRAC